MPGQAGFAPAVDLVALAIGILVALESLKDIETIAVAIFCGKSSRAIRTNPAASTEEDQGFVIDLTLQFGKKVRVAHSAGVLIPFHLDRTGDASDPIPLGTGPHINQFGAWRQL